MGFLFLYFKARNWEDSEKEFGDTQITSQTTIAKETNTITNNVSEKKIHISARQIRQCMPNVSTKIPIFGTQSVGFFSATNWTRFGLYVIVKKIVDSKSLESLKLFVGVAYVFFHSSTQSMAIFGSKMAIVSVLRDFSVKKW